MTRIATLLLVLTIMSGCAANQPRVEEDDSILHYYGFYSGVILDRLRDLIKFPSSESQQDERTDARGWAAALRQTVWEYNVESANMCAKSLYTKVSCLPALDPPWLTEPPDKSPTAKELERRADWVMRRVERLWDGACEDFQKSHPDSDDYMEYCSIE